MTEYISAAAQLILAVAVIMQGFDITRIQNELNGIQNELNALIRKSKTL